MRRSDGQELERRTRPLLSRRRAIVILGAAAGLPLLPPAFRANGEAAPADLPGVFVQDDRLARWHGVSMGADAAITLHHPDPGRARAVIEACLEEAQRLERIFSLHIPRSELCILNRDARLDFPSPDMLRLMAASLRFGALSGGAFDVTVQPLWRLYADHFARAPHDEAGPGESEIAAARARVDYRRIELGLARIRLAAGTEVTLNGIAQGYITDRVAQKMRGLGIAHVMIQMGETRAMGERPGGGAWRIGVRDPAAPDRIARVIPLADRALATSGAYGLRFDAQGRFHHLFDPATGRPSPHYLSVSVIAPEATTADALSTALYAMPIEAARRLIGRTPGVTAFLTCSDGRTIALAA